MTSRLEATTPPGAIRGAEPVVQATSSTATAGPAISTLLDGRYRLDWRLGHGGMGVVYQAFDVRLGRVVAVKLLSEVSPANETRLIGEMRTLARLSHPNLVRLLDAQLGCPAYLVMELIDGMTLARRLGQGPLTYEETARTGAGIAAALAYVHAQGIVHRDVKPENVLLDAEGTPYLADFGIARLLGTTRCTAAGVALGTPAYLAPEQLQGSAIGPETDVYALGLVLIECLSGRRAFEGTEAEVVAARLHRDPDVPGKAGEMWRQLLTSMTARTPSDRITASQVAESLSSGSVAGSPSGHSADGKTDALPTASYLPIEPAAKRTAHRRRSRFVASAIVVAALVILGLVLSGTFEAKPIQPAKPAGSKASSTSITYTSTTISRHVATTAPGPKPGTPRPATPKPGTKVPNPPNAPGPTSQPNLANAGGLAPAGSVNQPTSTVVPSTFSSGPASSGFSGQPGPGHGNSFGDGNGQWQGGRDSHGHHHGLGGGNANSGEDRGFPPGGGNSNGQGDGS